MDDMTTWITREGIDLRLTAGSQLETITAMLEMARTSAAVTDVERLAQAVLYQEVITPSLTGCCAVVFNALSDAVSQPQIFFGRFDKGIGYHTTNGRPVALVLLVVSPPEREEEFKLLVSVMKRALQDPNVRASLRGAKNVDQVLDLLSQILRDSRANARILSPRNEEER